MQRGDLKESRGSNGGGGGVKVEELPDVGKVGGAQQEHLRLSAAQWDQVFEDYREDVEQETLTQAAELRLSDTLFGLGQALLLKGDIARGIEQANRALTLRKKYNQLDSVGAFFSPPPPGC